MGTRNRNGIALLGVALALTGCTRIDNALASVPFFAFMRSSPAFDPYEATRPAPANTVPFESPAGEYVPPIATSPIGPSLVGTEAGLRAFADSPWGQNPFANDDLLELGRAQYTENCMVCHGTGGLGDGPATGENKYPVGLARNLTLPNAVGLPDGYIYGIIRAGRGLMPPYGTRIDHRQRWAIVQYVRELQRQAGAQPGQPAGGE